jgi:hypothetical protein
MKSAFDCQYLHDGAGLFYFAAAWGSIAAIQVLVIGKDNKPLL